VSKTSTDDLLREVATELRNLTKEIRASRERKITTRRVKSARRVARLEDVPVDDFAQAMAKRALRKLGGC
jgi:hypothetical protein